MTPASENYQIVQEITINAPAERVFEALTDPNARPKWWWSAEGRFKVTYVESDLRPGGKWLMRGIGRNEQSLSVRGEYRQIEPPQVLVFSWLADWQEDKTETLVRWDLTEEDGVTTVRLTHSGFASASSRASYGGWHYILGGLQGYVESE